MERLRSSLVKGEKVTPLRPMPQCWVVLVKPRLSVSTGKIFQEVDLDQLHHPDIQELSDAILARKIINE